MSTSSSPHRTISVLGLILSLLLITARSVSAKGNFDKPTVQDIASGREFQVTEPALMGFFGLSDFDNGTRETPKVGTGYEITRWAISRVDGETYVPVDRLRYYPSSSTNTLGRGWIFYEGLVNGSSEYDGMWFTTTRNSDALMQRILSSTQTLEASRPTPMTFGLIGIGAAGLIGIIATLWFFRQRGLPLASKRSG